jgi:hypothetical protein
LLAQLITLVNLNEAKTLHLLQRQNGFRQFRQTQIKREERLTITELGLCGNWSEREILTSHSSKKEINPASKEVLKTS